MKNLRFGVIGYGAWGSHHARSIASAEGAELVAVTTRSETSRAAARDAHPTARIYEDFHLMLGQEELDVVDVVVPTDLHYAAAKAVLESGRHLLLEKPMAPRLDQCNELIGLAKAKNLHLAVGHELRHSSLWGKVREMIHGGAVGDPQYVLIELWRRPYRLGSEGWRYDIRRVGNWILEEPIHFFDLARWYLGADPVSVYARANSRQVGHPELQDNFSAVLNFPGGAYAVVTQTLAAFEHHQTVKVSGMRGSLVAVWNGALDRDLHPVYTLRYHDGEKIEVVPIPKITGEVYELEDEIAMMVRAVRDGGPIAATGEDGQWSVALCLAAQESVETGSVVPLAKLLGETPG